LLQDKQSVNYCIACQELDTDTDKDNPGMSISLVNITETLLQSQSNTTKHNDLVT